MVDMILFLRNILAHSIAIAQYFARVDFLRCRIFSHVWDQPPRYRAQRKRGGSVQNGALTRFLTLSRRLVSSVRHSGDIGPQAAMPLLPKARMKGTFI